MRREQLWRFVLRRLLGGGLVLLMALTLAFATIHLMPGEPAQILLGGPAAGNDPRQEQELRHQLGLDRPLVQQYLSYLANTVPGNSGRSFQTGEPVTELIGAATPATLSLAAAALVLSLVLGIAVAAGLAVTRFAPLRAVLASLPVLAMSLPAYWVALMLIQVFSFRFALFPAGGDDGFDSLVLPAVTMALPAAGVVAQVLYSGIRAASAESYVVTARAKGAGRRRVLFRHVLRNACLPAITVLGTTIGNLLAAAVVAETVFARPGLGRLTVTAILNHDFPVIQGMVVLVGTVYVVVNLLIDLMYQYVDPRVTVSSAKG